MKHQECANLHAKDRTSFIDRHERNVSSLADGEKDPKEMHVSVEVPRTWSHDAF